jgi:hypothetical protein
MDASGALTGQTGSVAGVSARVRALTASGALVGQSGSVSGTASRTAGVTNHTTTGDLSGQIGSVTGSSALLRVIPSSGPLLGTGSSVVGSANRASPPVSHGTSGALVGQMAVVSGESRVGELNQPSYTGSVDLERRWYVRRGKKLHIFATAQDADAFIEAEEQAQEVVDRANKASRMARKRIRDKVFTGDSLPIQTIEVDRLQEAIAAFNLPIDLPSFVANQDWEQVVRTMLEVQQAQDEEDVEMLLLM